MKRLFYVAAGAVIGVAAMRRLTRAAQAWSPDGIAGRAAHLGAEIRDFAGDVRVGMAEREAALREALDLDDDPDDVRG